MARIDFERLVAKLHVDRILDGLGFQPTGIHVIIAPETSISNIWQDAAALAVRDIRNFRQGGAKASESPEIMDFPFQPMEPAETGYDVDTALMRHNMGIESGIDDAACTLIFADSSDAEHPSVPLADSVIRPELDIDLVILAAAQCGRQITADEATLLSEMPWRRRRIAISAARSISETHRLHLQAVAAEEERKANEAKDAKDAKEKGKKPAERTVPDVRPLTDMHGYGDAKDWGLELAKDIEDWRNGVIAWSDVDNGVLLSGPPGCGKTTFASALAKTLDAHLVIGSYAAWIGTGDGHQGDLIRAMREAFAEAREHAPSVILVDEIDNFVQRGSIGHGRSDEWMRGVVNALLESLDGAIERAGVIVVGATNDASGIDAALSRPGRLDRHIEIPLPDAETRQAILRQHLGVAEGFPLRLFERKTQGMSGADLERLARDARRLARRECREVRPHHIAAALPRRERRSEDELRHIAVHEIGHAVVAAHLGATVHEVFVIRDRDPEASMEIAGAAAVQPRAGRRDYQWYVDRVAHLLGGLAAERMVYGSHADGVVADLVEATNLLTYALSSVGMGGTLGSDGHRDPAAMVQARQFDPGLRRRVEDGVQEQAERARGILERHRGAFDELVEVLILRSRLGGDEVHETIEAYAQPQLSLAI